MTVVWCESKRLVHSGVYFDALLVKLCDHAMAVADAVPLIPLTWMTCGQSPVKPDILTRNVK